MAAYQRHTIQSKWGDDYAAEQVEWHRNQIDPRKVTAAELAAYAKGVKDGWSKAIVTLILHGLIRTDRVSGCES